MKLNFKWFFIFSISLFFFVGLPKFSHAQDDDLPSPCQDPIDGDCPIDSGLLILIAVGAGYGIKKVVDSRKANAIE